MPVADPARRSKSAKPGDSSYEDGWYQVLKRRADESDDDA